MQSLFWLIPLSFGFLAVACMLFSWAVDHGQFEDLDRESERVLIDPEIFSRSTDTPLKVNSDIVPHPPSTGSVR